MSRRPRLLDLFCGAGGAAMGYSRAGFDVTGIDLKPQPRYPFRFIQADGTRLPVRLRDFDAVHASPPCQGYLNEHFRVTPSGHVRQDHPRLIADMRAQLVDVPVWVIENIESAIDEMVHPIRLCGTSFGLPLRRHRLFESSVAMMQLQCRHELFTEAKYPTQFRPQTGQNHLARVVQVYGNGKGAKHWPAAMGIEWMNRRELTQAIPPAYCEFIGKQLMQAIEVAA